MVRDSSCGLPGEREVDVLERTLAGQLGDAALRGDTAVVDDDDVIGQPLRLSGAEGTQSEKMRRFAEDLHTHFGLPVHLWDERWTSTQANRLLREAELSIEKRAQAVDRMAAILILQSWMEAHPR